MKFLPRPRVAFFTTGCFSLLLGLALGLPQARAAVIAFDDFTAPDGTLIQGRVTPVGGLTWTNFSSAGNAVIESNGVTTNAGGSSGYYSVPFSVGSSTSFEIDADMWPRGNNMNLTFASTSTAGQGTPQMTIWAAVNYAGGWALFQGATGLAGGGGLTVGSTSYGVSSLKYDVTTSTLTFSVNNVQLYSGVVTSFNVADITTAGMSYSSMSAENVDPQVRSFTLVAVPEPQTWTLAALGASAVMLRLRRQLLA